ncbi:MAG: nucleotidyltransferase domain-containing protein [Candidatus Aenigmatarchaeota archaeon]
MINNLTKTELEVLMYFVQKPGAEKHIRGLSGEIDLPYSSTRNALKSLEEQNYLESEERGNLKFYTPGEEFRNAKKVLNIRNIMESGLTDYLEEKLRPDAVVLFGSYLEGRDTESSDIDIAVVNGREKDVELEKFEEELGRDIQIIHVPEIGEESAEFINTLANGYTLSGFLEAKA